MGQASGERRGKKKRSWGKEEQDEKDHWLFSSGLWKLWKRMRRGIKRTMLWKKGEKQSYDL